MASNSFRYRHLANTFRDSIQRGIWLAGDRLPSVREVMSEHNLSRSTVLHAYTLLEAEGLITARPQRGYFVSGPTAMPDAPLHRTPVSQPRLLSLEEVINDVMMQGAAFDLLPEQGQVDEAPLELEALHRCVGRALRQQKGLQHQYYDEPDGLPALRDILAQRLRKQGCHVNQDDVTITSGCQHALLLALMSCTRPGDVVAVESPGFFGSLQVLQQLGLQVLELPCDPLSGLDLDSLEQALRQWPIKAMVVTPTYATPTGSCMPADQRLRLIRMARQHSMVLIEDHIYGEMGLNASPPAPLFARDPDNVILCSSFSKSLSRDLRVGWVVNRKRHGEFSRLKRITTLANSRFIQQGLVDFIQNGDYDRHLRRYLQRLRHQRNGLAELLGSVFPGCSFTLPEGGLCLWLALPEHTDTMAIYATARQQGVVITPGAMFTTQPDLYRHYLRLSFAHPWNQHRRQALQTVARLVAGQHN
ncbi:hypothetical protein WH50_17185 [Pokkaliibacter plantistimulans]|uniref:HTH gntR-type domain-containing protein n=1 Tax=Pokkaliibacter plantistimulans TaxID=1635171 RepID=A0ABX5LV45_9GAMM|nr:PLP-dependent aminotransferase family protein [Pokkaliibacter plantistimulans]PXF30092.1 hypothetical protein WH50_17185 [Pokkaliibacter plantistimulans]